MNIKQLINILSDINGSLNANLHTDYQSHLKRLEEIGLDVTLDKEIKNIHKPKPFVPHTVENASKIIDSIKRMFD